MEIVTLENAKVIRQRPSFLIYIYGTTGLKAHLKKKICYSLNLKYIIAQKRYALYWKLMEQQILCANKTFKLFILFKIHINVWGATSMG